MADISRGYLIGTRGCSYRVWGTPEPGYRKPTGHQFYHFLRVSKNFAQAGRVKSPPLLKRFLAFGINSYP